METKGSCPNGPTLSNATPETLACDEGDDRDDGDERDGCDDRDDDDSSKSRISPHEMCLC